MIKGEPLPITNSERNWVKRQEQEKDREQALDKLDEMVIFITINDKRLYRIGIFLTKKHKVTMNLERVYNKSITIRKRTG